MNEQDKRTERMIKLAIFLFGLLILLKAGQAVLSRYEQPEEVWLHTAMAQMALWGKELYLPALLTEERKESSAGFLMDQAATFLGWNSGKESRIYVEDEYTRQELIEAGRGGSFSDIRKENEQAAMENQEVKGSAQETEENKQSQAEENAAQESSVPDEQHTDAADSVKKADEQQVQQFLRVADLAEAEKYMSSEELLSKYFVVDTVTKADASMISFEKLAQPDFSVSQAEKGTKQILIYHTHSQEEFRDSVKNDADTTIVGVGTYLSQLLTEKGYQVLHLTDTFDLIGGGVDRNKAYSVAREKLKRVLEENPSIQVILDIHRDGVPESKRLVTTIDGRPTAQIMFFNGMSYKKTVGNLSGLSNPYIQENLAFSFQAEYLCDYYYPSLSRCIYLKAYRYNLDLLPRSMLVEVGAQTNTVQEAKNAMIPLADVLHKLLQGA